MLENEKLRDSQYEFDEYQWDDDGGAIPPSPPIDDDLADEIMYA